MNTCTARLLCALAFGCIIVYGFAHVHLGIQKERNKFGNGIRYRTSRSTVRRTARGRGTALALTAVVRLMRLFDMMSRYCTTTRPTTSDDAL